MLRRQQTQPPRRPKSTATLAPRSDAKPLTKELVRLHLSAKRSALLRRAPPYQSSLQKVYGAMVLRAQSHGRISALMGARGLRAAFLVAPGRRSGQPQLTAAIDYGRRDAAVSAWLKTQCRAHQDILSDPRTGLLLPTHQRWLMPHLLSQGCHIEAVILAGDVAGARRALCAAYRSRLYWPDESGVTVTELRTRAQVEQVIALIRREFRRSPQYCWFAAKQKYLKQLRREFNRSRERRAGQATHFVMLRERRVVGYFGFQTPRLHPWVGRHAAVAMTFAREVQGEGYAKFAYAHMLRRMEKMHIKVFMGGTAQPPVMNLGAAMGRQVVGYYLRGGAGHFPAAHFSRPNILSIST